MSAKAKVPLFLFHSLTHLRVPLSHPRTFHRMSMGVVVVACIEMSTSTRTTRTTRSAYRHPSLSLVVGPTVECL